MKRFFTLMMAIIIMAIMLTTTVYAAVDAVRMVFDENEIKMIAQEGTIATLKIDISLGNINETISKKIELTEKTTTTLNVDDLVFEYFSDFYKESDAKIVNVVVEDGQTVEEVEMDHKFMNFGFIFFGFVVVGFIVGQVLDRMLFEKPYHVMSAIIVVGAIIGIAYLILA